MAGVETGTASLKSKLVVWFVFQNPKNLPPSGLVILFLESFLRKQWKKSKDFYAKKIYAAA